MTGDGGAASLWIPPGEPELSDADDARLEPLVRELIGSHADEVLALFERFDANHPRHEPHFYLSLLGTHPDHRGLRANRDRRRHRQMPVGEQKRGGVAVR